MIGYFMLLDFLYYGWIEHFLVLFIVAFYLYTERERERGRGRELKRIICIR